MRTTVLCGVLTVFLTLLPGPLRAVTDPPMDRIGVFTAVYGQVTVRHAGEEAAFPVLVKDGVRYQDLIETYQASRMRALLDDDTLLTLDEASRLDIVEHLYDPAAGQRIAVLRLVQGTVRALVGKFLGGGSKFEIHSGSAIAAARGTYFVVWIEVDGRTGIANIGDEGDVGFTSGGQEVVVRPGHYSVTRQNSVPLPPAVIQQDPGVIQVVTKTDIRDNIAVLTPQKALQAFGGAIEKSLPKSRLSLQPVVDGPETAGSQGNAQRNAFGHDGPAITPAAVIPAPVAAPSGTNSRNFSGNGFAKGQNK